VRLSDKESRRGGRSRHRTYKGGGGDSAFLLDSTYNFGAISGDPKEKVLRKPFDLGRKIQQKYNMRAVSLWYRGKLDPRQGGRFRLRIWNIQCSTLEMGKLRESSFEWNREFGNEKKSWVCPHPTTSLSHGKEVCGKGRRVKVDRITFQRESEIAIRGTQMSKIGPGEKVQENGINGTRMRAYGKTETDKGNRNYFIAPRKGLNTLTHARNDENVNREEGKEDIKF